MSTSASPNNIRFVSPIYDEIEIESDIDFGEVTNFKGELYPLKLDVYQPKQDDEPSRPVILFIHGGAFKTGSSKKQSYIVDLATRFAKKGYVCLSSDYRVRDNPFEDRIGACKDAVSDTILALNWIRMNHIKFRIDTNKIILTGGSAGGFIAVDICYGKRSNDGFDIDLTGVIGLINLWGSPPQEQWEITNKSLPAFIVHGTNDEIVPFSNSEKMADLLQQNGVFHGFLRIEGAPHTPIMYMNQIEDSISKFLLALLEDPHCD